MKKTVIAAIATVALFGAVASCGDDDQGAPAPKPEKAVQQPQDTPEKVEKDAPAPPKEQEPVETVGQQQAVMSAQAYVDTLGFSKDGLIEQLKFEKFSQADAEYAAENVNADWNAEAVESAEGYMDLGGFSRASLIDQLIFEQFTPEQAEYAVGKVGL